MNGHRATLDADPDAAPSGLSGAPEARLKGHWLRLAGTIVSAAQAVGEADHRAGTLGAFRTYRSKKQHHKEAQQKRMDLQHNEVVSHFRLRRLSVDAVESAAPAAGSVAAYAQRGFSLTTGRRRHGSSNGSTPTNGAPAVGGRAAAVTACWTAASGLAGPWDPDALWRRPWNAIIVAIVCAQV